MRACACVHLHDVKTKPDMLPKAPWLLMTREHVYRDTGSFLQRRI
jgi:hypothetical protein